VATPASTHPRATVAYRASAVPREKPAKTGVFHGNAGDGWSLASMSLSPTSNVREITRGSGLLFVVCGRVDSKQQT